jgi:hypothetical protein
MASAAGVRRSREFRASGLFAVEPRVPQGPARRVRGDQQRLHHWQHRDSRPGRGGPGRVGPPGGRFPSGLIGEIVCRATQRRTVRSRFGSTPRPAWTGTPSGAPGAGFADAATQPSQWSALSQGNRREGRREADLRSVRSGLRARHSVSRPPLIGLPEQGKSAVTARPRVTFAQLSHRVLSGL